MILSRKLSDALNEQINMEMWSSNLYLSMSVHFTQIGLDGFTRRHKISYGASSGNR